MTHPPEEAAELEASRAPFLEHLEELRRRLWRAVLAFIVAAVVCYLFRDLLYQILTRPLFDTLEGLKLNRAVSFRTVAGPFLFHMKSAALFGVFVASPVVLYQLWKFVAPGLYRSERILALPFVAASTTFFVGGAVFAYFLVLPEAFGFMLGFAVTEGPFQLIPDINIEDYLGFVIKLLLAFGIAFELPVAVAFLAGIGLVTHRGLLRFWRYAVVIMFVLAALLTPPDVVSQIMLALPLSALYGLSIGLAWLITRRREDAAAAAEAEGGSPD